MTDSQIVPVKHITTAEGRANPYATMESLLTQAGITERDMAVTIRAVVQLDDSFYGPRPFIGISMTVGYARGEKVSRRVMVKQDTIDLAELRGKYSELVLAKQAIQAEHQQAATFHKTQQALIDQVKAEVEEEFHWMLSESKFQGKLRVTLYLTPAEAIKILKKFQGKLRVTLYLTPAEAIKILKGMEK